jgi:hypothetical protein
MQDFNKRAKSNCAYILYSEKTARDAAAAWRQRFNSVTECHDIVPATALRRFVKGTATCLWEYTYFTKTNLQVLCGM